MNGINEKIKHAETVDEVHALLELGKGQANASQRTMNRRERIARKRIVSIRHSAATHRTDRAPVRAAETPV